MTSMLRGGGGVFCGCLVHKNKKSNKFADVICVSPLGLVIAVAEVGHQVTDPSVDEPGFEHGVKLGIDRLEVGALLLLNLF